MIRILVADDHELIREGLRKVFHREPDLQLVDAVCDGAEAVAAVRRHDIDVAILDFNMPGRSGVDVIGQLLAVQPGLPVLILSFMPERDIALRVFRAGGAGFVSKRAASEEIVTAVRQVAAGRRYVSPVVAEQLASAAASPGQQGLLHDQLSERELQVLKLIAAGANTRSMAQELCLSVNTIATYRRRIREKLGLKTDAEAVRYVLEHGLSS